MELLHGEIELSVELKSDDREKLLYLLGVIEVEGPEKNQDTALKMFDILVTYPSFEAEYVDFATRYFGGEPDDRRTGQ